MGTITATSIGTNTVQITSAGTNNTLTELMQDFSDAVTGVAPVRVTGWATHDSFTVGVVKTQVFKSLNKDGVTYKYFIARWNIMTGEINTATCESWDAVNHIATNEAWTFFDCAPIGFKLSACDLIVNVNPRWLVLTSYINNEPGLWAGVFEMEREDVADTAAAGYPCWGWISSTLWMLGASSYAAKPLNTADHTLISVPRTRSGATGVNAAKSWAGDYGMAQSPSWASTGNSSFVYFLGNQVNKFLANAWDTAKRLVMPIKPVFDYTAQYPTNYGNIYGLKVLAPAGQNMNKIKINVDSDGNYSPSGTLTDHWLLNNHHKYEATASSWFGNSGLTVTAIDVAERPEYLCSTGQAYYVTTATKLKKINALLNTYADVSTGTYYDLKYDGERYIYVGTASGLMRLDTVDDSMVNLAIAGGVQTMAINSTHIVCTPYTASATPVITRVKRSDFTVETVNGSLTLSTFTEAVRIVDAIVGYDDSVLMVAPVATAGNFKLTVIPKGTSAAVSYSTALGQYASANVGLQIVDENNAVMWWSVSLGVTYMTQFNPKNLTLIGTAGMSVGTNVTLNGSVKGSCNKIDGILQFYPRNNAAGNLAANVTLGKTVTTSLTTPVMNAEFTSTLNGTSTVNNFLYWDGTKAIGNYATGIRIYGNIHGQFTYSNVTLGQVTIPA